jgi:predicted O-methyltransferase YrrM
MEEPGHAGDHSSKQERSQDKKFVAQMKRVIGQLARLGPAFDITIDPRFHDAAERMVKAKRTMLGYDRLFTLWQAAVNVAPLGLPVVEIGTFRGGSAALLAEGLAAANAACDVHVVDTFAGHIDATITAHDSDEHFGGKFANTSYEDVQAFLAAYPGMHVHQGNAATVIAGWPDRRYGLVHIDVDLYGPTLECLRYFGPRLAEGGVLVMDDYESPTCPGVSLAVHEYLSAGPRFQQWRLHAEQMLLIKT